MPGHLFANQTVMMLEYKVVRSRGLSDVISYVEVSEGRVGFQPLGR